MQPKLQLQCHLEEELFTILQRTDWIISALRTVRSLSLPHWCIGAGALRNVVWDWLHKYTKPSFLSDIDVAYFDVADVTRQRDRDLDALLTEKQPGAPWQVTNQAGVHLWFNRRFGYSVEPLISIEDAVGSWPETATSVAVSLLPDDQLKLIAPYGLGDLFSMIIRRNPRRVSVEEYRRRIVSKKYQERWPKVRIVLE